MAAKKITAPVDSTSFVEPSVRTIVDWSPDMFKAARYAADAGDISLAADFCEAAMADERIGSAINTRCKGLIGLPVRFESARGKSRPVRALEAEEDWWTIFPEAETAMLLAWGITLGVGFAKLHWNLDTDSTRMVPTIEVWHPRHFRWKHETRSWYVRLANGTEIPIAAGDGTWVIYTPYGTNRPWAWGIWRALALWQLLKTYALQDWARYSERHGSGMLVAETPGEWSKEKRKETARELADLGSTTAIALPAGVKLSLLEATANTWETFQAQIAAANLGESVACVGQNLSTEVTGSVSTGATLHSKVLFVYVQSDEATTTTMQHDQVLVWYAEFNFGSAALAPWVRYDITPPADKQAEAKRLGDVATALKTFGEANAPVDVRALLELHGVPMKKAIEGDDDAIGTLYQYHFTFGVISLNEARKRLGLPPVDGGDKPPQPMAMPKAGSSDTGAADEATKAALVEWDAMLAEYRAKAGKPTATKAGQAFIDALTDAQVAAARDALAPQVEATLAAVQEATSFDDVRARVLASYRERKATALTRRVQDALTAAHLAGRVALTEEISK